MKLLTTYILSGLLFIFSCNSNSGQKNKEEKIPAATRSAIAKPPANFQDTIEVNFPAAIFYHPDSLQLQKIKEITKPGVFDASTHEYFYQMRNARISIKRDWPEVKIIEAKNVRFLLFRGKDDDPTYIDLDTKNDPYGLFLFQPGKNLVDQEVMNIICGPEHIHAVKKCIFSPRHERL